MEPEAIKDAELLAHENNPEDLPPFDAVPGTALVSIAISLKRIADAITPQPGNDIAANIHQLLCTVVDFAENNETHMSEISEQINGVPYDRTPGADNTGHRMGLVDGIMHAIEQGLLAASQRG